jgi:NitT/TauT family transport system permease protein
MEQVDLYFARRPKPIPRPETQRRLQWTLRVLAVLGIAVVLYAVVRMSLMLAHLTGPDLAQIFLGDGATFLRVEFTLVLAGLWTIPVGVYVGLRPRLSAIAQPVAQIAASVPATALFPIVLLALIRVGGGLGVGSILLMLLGTQWYILFNVIAGASAIPTDLKEVCGIFHMSNAERWRKLFLPAIFPYLVTGFVTASGGAWNASIVAEYSKIQGKTYSTVGLGAVISRATDAGDFAVLLGATVVMAATVVTVNRLFWRKMYVLASTRYKLES